MAFLCEKKETSSYLCVLSIKVCVDDLLFFLLGKERDESEEEEEDDWVAPKVTDAG